MAIRVHELAKEFKISTAALKKHLKDMGVVVKSHMSPVDDEVAENIRKKFKAEVEAIKQRQFDRQNFQQRIVKTKKKIVKTPEKKPPVKPSKPTIVQVKKPEVPKFVEKEVTTHKPVQKTKEETGYKKKRKYSDKVDRIKKTIPKPKVDQNIPTVSLTEPDKKFTKEIKSEKKENFEQKDKHLKAKLKHLKKKSKRSKTFVPSEFEEAEIAKNIKKTLQNTPKKKKYKKEEKDQNIEDTKLTISEFTSVSELAKMMDVQSTEIITKFFMMGQMVTINQRLDKESLEMICTEFNFDVEFQDEYGAEIIESQQPDQESVDQISRPPIVTIMGHVDHGKTSILDHIRQTNIIAGESGGITQHIGAYQVVYNDQKVTFIDTPGHEAFTAMRARGANVTDIAIIVVAANESVKPQTIEAIDHAKAAGVTIIVAINKVDLKEANVDRTISDLMKQNIYLENYGGETLWTTCSAKTGEGINELLDLILLTSEMQELTTPKDVSGKGIVVESEKDARMGTIITLLLQEGSLEKGDSVVCGATYGRIRKMENERGKELQKITASDVARVYGLNSVPKAGDILNQVESEKMARQVGSERLHIRQEREKYQGKTNLGNLFQKIKEHEMSEIKLIVKADTDGSVEALCDSFQKLSNEEVAVNIIRKAVGGINEADISLASASDAIVIGFHVRASNVASKLAEDEGVDIRIYQIIYEAIDAVKQAMTGLLQPTFEEKYLGNALVKQTFRIKKVGTIAGCFVDKGVIRRDSKIRLYRNDVLLHEGNLASLKHFANEVPEVKAGSECGIAIENFNDIKEGDMIENYFIEEVERKL